MPKSCQLVTKVGLLVWVMSSQYITNPLMLHTSSVSLHLKLSHLHFLRSNLLCCEILHVLESSSSVLVLVVIVVCWRCCRSWLLRWLTVVLLSLWETSIPRSTSAGPPSIILNLSDKLLLEFCTTLGVFLANGQSSTNTLGVVCVGSSTVHIWARVAQWVDPISFNPLCRNSESSV